MKLGQNKIKKSFWKRNNKLLKYIFEKLQEQFHHCNLTTFIRLLLIFFCNTLNSFYVLMNFYSNPMYSYIKTALLSNREKQTKNWILGICCFVLSLSLMSHQGKKYTKKLQSIPPNTGIPTQVIFTQQMGIFSTSLLFTNIHF